MPFYVVWKGRNPGVYNTWDEAKAQVEGFPGALYRKFKTLEDALAAFRGETNVADAYSDASYNGRTLSIRVVDARGRTLHSDSWSVEGVQPINVGEFIAIVRALRLTQGTVATDSQVAYTWVQAGAARTGLVLPEDLKEALEEAQAWLRENPEARLRLKKVDRAFNKAD
jgi:Predicted double-stranded RNA/RNA-DNA hybrid binding protein